MLILATGNENSIFVQLKLSYTFKIYGYKKNYELLIKNTGEIFFESELRTCRVRPLGYRYLHNIILICIPKLYIYTILNMISKYYNIIKLS